MKQMLLMLNLKTIYQEEAVDISEAILTVTK